MVDKFTTEDDQNLVLYIAENYPVEVEGRERKDLYKRLVENVSSEDFPSLILAAHIL